jgi:DNA-binding CsgD family transcriptional regulator
MVEWLTGREQEVLLELARGLTTPQIAIVMFISQHTVKYHLQHIYEKLDLTGGNKRAHAVRYAVQREGTGVWSAHA